MDAMSVKSALLELLNNVKAMSKEEVLSELSLHRNGEFATALRELQGYVALSAPLYSFAVEELVAMSNSAHQSKTFSQSVDSMIEFVAANDPLFTLAA